MMTCTLMSVPSLLIKYAGVFVYVLLWIMVFNATFSNISAIAWRSVLLLKETGVPGENHRPVASH